jgi:hypothetical protein
MLIRVLAQLGFLESFLPIMCDLDSVALSRVASLVVGE